ncbi:hypothetical protein HOY80DRAFT_165093 [Tuber brumale]|nr:hypothetical protein HOY80DRAFT_165093 [Tuber brumale]
MLRPCPAAISLWLLCRASCTLSHRYCRAGALLSCGCVVPVGGRVTVSRSGLGCLVLAVAPRYMLCSILSREPQNRLLWKG